ncbi:hypothetical protein ACJX0J_035807, partial [Zea mays]
KLKHIMYLNVSAAVEQVLVVPGYFLQYCVVSKKNYFGVYWAIPIWLKRHIDGILGILYSIYSQSKEKKSE